MSHPSVKTKAKTARIKGEEGKKETKKKKKELFNARFIENNESKVIGMIEQKLPPASVTPPLRRTRWKTPRGSSEGDDFSSIHVSLVFVRFNLCLLAREIPLLTHKINRLAVEEYILYCAKERRKKQALIVAPLLLWRTHVTSAHTICMSRPVSFSPSTKYGMCTQ